MNYSATNDDVTGAEIVLDKGRSACENGRYHQAIKLALCVIGEMVDLIQNADDSNGTIGDIIDEGFIIINSIVDDIDLNPYEKESIFSELILESTHKRYKGWEDWLLQLLEISSYLADNANLRNLLESTFTLLLNNAEKDKSSNNYLSERINTIKYHMILRYDDEEKAADFMKQNLHITCFRKMTIEDAIQKKNYDYVIKLALEAEEKDREYAGLVSDWKKYRYQACVNLKRIDEQRDIAMYFILNNNSEYYNLLKKTYTTAEWPAIYNKIIRQLEEGNKTYLDIYTRILVTEGKKKKLLEYVKKNPSSIESNYKHLIPDFADDVIAIYYQYIEETAARANNRKHYQNVCGIIRNLKKACGVESIIAIKKRLYDKNANRPAFIEELGKV